MFSLDKIIRKMMDLKREVEFQKKLNEIKGL